MYIINIWILDSDSGITMLYKSYMEMHVNEDLVSGLLTALNQFTIMEFKQGIESIDMAGLRWVYVDDSDCGLMFIAAADKTEKAEMLRARLNVIRQSFIQEYIENPAQWKNNWNGNVEMFRPFEKTIDEYYHNWIAAESVTSVAEFFDILGIFQQIFFDIFSVIQNHIPIKVRVKIFLKIEEMFENYKNSDYVKHNSELSKITFSRSSGINIITINPNNCDMFVVEKQIINLMKRLINTIREETGFEECLIYFVKEHMFDYILNNISLLNQLNIDKFLLQLFLTEL